MISGHGGRTARPNLGAVQSIRAAEKSLHPARRTVGRTLTDLRLTKAPSYSVLARNGSPDFEALPYYKPSLMV